MKNTCYREDYSAYSVDGCPYMMGKGETVVDFNDLYHHR
jgi:hypothetical protein